MLLSVCVRSHICGAGRLLTLERVMRWGRSRTIRRVWPAGFIPPCLPTISNRVPKGDAWLYEVKHDGYRLMLNRKAERLRIFTRSGNDWVKRYPLIETALRALKVQSVVFDGEGVWCGENGIPDFAKLHSRGYDDEVTYFAFDLLEIDGVNLRLLPLQERKKRLRTLLRGNKTIRYVEHFDSDGELMFAHACSMGLEGIVSKRRDLPYRSGLSKSWVKIKNPRAPAVLRLLDDVT